MIHEALRLIRVFHDLKQTELSKRIGVSVSYISEIEKGTKSPSLDVIDKYAKEFHVPVSSILFFSEELPNVKSGDKIRTRIADKMINILKLVESKSDAENVH